MKHDPTDWKHAIACKPCNKERSADWVPQTVYLGIVPGGANDTPDIQWRRDFGPGLDAYKKARDEGIQPDHSTLESVDAAHRRIKSQEAGLKAIKNFSDIDGVRTTPGVNRDV